MPPWCGSTASAAWSRSPSCGPRRPSALRFHDLRHGALTEAARHGATLAELMALGGHSTSHAAMRYQQAASQRLAELARKRSEATGWTAKEDDNG